MYCADSRFKIAVYGAHGSIGDEVMALRVLFSIKFLYPNSHLTFLANSSMPFSLFKNIQFIDRIFNVQKDSSAFLEEFDVLLFVFKHDMEDRIQIARKFKVTKTLMLFSQYLLKIKGFSYLFDSAYTRGGEIIRIINPYWKQDKNRVILGALRLVRALNKKHYDKNIQKIPLSKAKIITSRENKVFVDLKMQKLGANSYDKIIGISPFGKSSSRGNANFSIEEWVEITKFLAKKYQNYFFVLMNYEGNPIEIEGLSEINSGIFVNNKDLLNLVELIGRLDLLLSVDTSNVHIADNLQIPTLEIIRQSEAKKWGGGSYGGVCEQIILPKEWKSNSQYYQNLFIQKSQELLENHSMIYEEALMKSHKIELKSSNKCYNAKF